jgi:hypothetical protein
METKKRMTNITPERERELEDQMNEYYEYGVHLEYINRLERLIGITETTLDEFKGFTKHSYAHLFLLACVRIERLQEEQETDREMMTEQYVMEQMSDTDGYEWALKTIMELQK